MCGGCHTGPSLLYVKANLLGGKANLLGGNINLPAVET
jgi:hypothetical protein